MDVIDKKMKRSRRNKKRKWEFFDNVGNEKHKGWVLEVRRFNLIFPKAVHTKI
jgi:hypothetical protein